VVITLRMPQHGAATVPTYVTPAASQTASPPRAPRCPPPVVMGPPASRAPGSRCPGPLRLPRTSRHASLCRWSRRFLASSFLERVLVLPLGHAGLGDARPGEA
jgi:hypothetical protein